MRFLFIIFGVLDLLTATSILLFEAAFIPYWVIAPFALDLLIKTVLFWGDTASLIDSIIAIYIVLLPLLGFWPISTVLALYLTQKGLLSFH